MKLTFLGTSSGWPLPRLGCDCNICTSENPRDMRLRPSLLINESVLIDAPPDIYTSLIRHDVNPVKITYIVLTHAHDDHIMGLFDLSHIYNSGKITIISTESILSRARQKFGVSMLSFKEEAVKPMEKVKVKNDFFVWFVPVEHTVEAYAIKIKAPRPIVYAPEFRRIKPSSKKVLGDLDLVVMDGSSKTKRGQAKGHQTIQEGLRLAKELSPKKVLFTNIGHKTDRHSDLVNYVREEDNGRYSIAYDGLELNV